MGQTPRTELAGGCTLRGSQVRSEGAFTVKKPDAILDSFLTDIIVSRGNFDVLHEFSPIGRPQRKRIRIHALSGTARAQRV